MALRSNPIPEILDLVPYEDTVLDVLLCDQMCKVLIPAVKHKVSNSMLCLLLAHLAEYKLITMTELTWPSTKGSVLILKRIPDGNV